MKKAPPSKITWSSPPVSISGSDEAREPHAAVSSKARHVTRALRRMIRSERISHCDPSSVTWDKGNRRTASEARRRSYDIGAFVCRTRRLGGSRRDNHRSACWHTRLEADGNRSSTPVPHRPSGRPRRRRTATTFRYPRRTDPACTRDYSVPSNSRTYRSRHRSDPPEHTRARRSPRRVRGRCPRRSLHRSQHPHRRRGRSCPRHTPQRSANMKPRLRAASASSRP